MAQLALALLALLAALLPQPAFAGAWMQAPGSGVLIQTLSTYETDHYYDDSGNRLRQHRYTKAEYNLYGEYGWRDGTTLGGSAFLQHINQENSRGDSDDNHALADPSLFLRQHILDTHGFTLSLQPLVKFPSRYREDRLPRSGSREWALEASLLAGYGFELFGHRHFADTRFGYRYRGGEPGDQLLSDMTLGISLGDRLLILPQISAAMAAGGVGGGFTQTGEDDYDLVKAQLSAVIALDSVNSVQAGLYRHAYARNTGSGGGFLLGWWRQW